MSGVYEALADFRQNRAIVLCFRRLGQGEVLTSRAEWLRPAGLVTLLGSGYPGPPQGQLLAWKMRLLLPRVHLGQIKFQSPKEVWKGDTPCDGHPLAVGPRSPLSQSP